MSEVANNSEQARWIVKDDAQQVALYASEQIAHIAQQEIERKGSFSIVLAGGTTPGQVYRLLAENKQCDWQNWQIYLGDERCLPLDNPDRNSQMIYKTLLSKVAIPQKNIHVIHSELGAVEAAALYNEKVTSALPFDMVLLGMGEDGHTASVFPGHNYNGNANVYAVFEAPKPPPERITLSVSALSQNRNLMIIVTGAGKKESVKGWKTGENPPVAKIGTLGSAVVLLDRDAMPE